MVITIPIVYKKQYIHDVDALFYSRTYITIYLAYMYIYPNLSLYTYLRKANWICTIFFYINE